MSANRTLALVVAVLGIAAGVRAQDAELARLFPYVAPVDAPVSGRICQLPLPEEVLRATRPDLSDLRLVEADGREVPTLLDRAAVRWPSGGPPAATTVVPDAVERSSEDGHVREELAFALPAEELPEGATWSLELEAAAGDFVRRTTLMAEDGTELARGSVFRFPSPLRERRMVVLPEPTPGRVYRLRLEGEGAYLEPVLRLVAGPMAERGSRLALPLAIVSRSDDGGVTTLELARPSGIVPSQLLFETRTPFFSREVAVFDRREGRAPEQVGQGTIFRADEADAAVLTLPVRRAVGDRIRVVLQRGDSPPLEGLAVTAVTDRPALFFTCREGQRMLYGGGRAGRPRYDTQRFAGTAIGEMIARGNVPQASLGATEANPAFDDGPALGSLLRPGREVERERFRSAAPVVVSGAREGVSRLVPSAALLARAAPDLADLRVVDGEGRQWPYVRAPDPQELEVPLEVEREELDDGRSRYLIRFAEGDLALERLRLRTPAGFVNRAFTARTLVDGEELLPGLSDRITGQLRREPGDDAPMEVELTSRPGPVELIVANGNDAPLELTAEGVVLAPVVYLLAPDGRYEALVGAEVPRAEYEVSRALGLVLATAVVDAELGAAGDNPVWEPPPVAPRFTTSQILVWAVLLLAVLVLGVLTIRVTREGGASGDESADDESDDDAAPEEPDDQPPVEPEPGPPPA